MPRPADPVKMAPTKERLLVPGEYDGSAEASVKVLSREAINGVAIASEILARVRVKLVDAKIVVTIERADDTLEVLVRGL